MKKTFVTGIVVLGVGALVVFVAARVPVQKDAVPASDQNKEYNPRPIPEGAVIIEMSDSGFSPKEITIKQGTAVVFKAVGSGSNGYWPASAIHPTHTIYPGSDIAKCGTSEEKGIFDACRGYTQGEWWEFQFNKVGEWRYHDHLNAKNFGVITVEE